MKLAECLAFMREGDVLTVTKPDRLARSTSELLSIEADLSKRGIGVQSSVRNMCARAHTRARARARVAVSKWAGSLLPITGTSHGTRGAVWGQHRADGGRTCTTRAPGHSGRAASFSGLAVHGGRRASARQEPSHRLPRLTQ